ncbi:hypothetical protein CY35_01G158900 [Sphagnum magellanicum]|nr:hypothetical protein CY35_01G158900 [Sphagnum magellanicum]
MDSVEDLRGDHFLEFPEVQPSIEVFCFVEEKEEKEDAFKEVSKKRGEIEGRGGRPSSSSSSASMEEAQEQECEELFPMAMDLRTPSSSGSRGLQRLWEGGLFEIGDHSDVTIQTAFCPCATFGRNMERSGFGTSWGQGGIFLLLSVGAVSFYITYVCTGSPWFIYGTLSLLLLMAMYAGHYRVRMRRRFNIIGSEGGNTVSLIDDHLYHLMCGCCSLCQEARTLKSNNVLNGKWHGRGDILVIGSQVLFTPAGTTQLSPAALQKFSPLRKLLTKVDKTLAVKASTSDPEAGHSWSSHTVHQQSLPLLQH